ncbi:MAG TPA: hypothetical protein VHN74_13590 [Candidatus Angelobacter sp.]|jgi:hypothetical protein|nr:hypothetical protein [Candidatus Angelobacter sp.]
MRFPIIIFLFSLAGLYLSVRTGIVLRRHVKELDEADFAIILTTTLTLLGIIIGFSFSMSVTRYDQRKNFEEEETNAIGTEYLRVELLPAAEADLAKQLLRKYTELRIAWYGTRNLDRILQIDRETADTQASFWSAVKKGASGQPAAVVALTVGGANDVINRQGYTEAAWLNSIPPAAWCMMLAIAIFGTVLLGMNAHKPGRLVTLTLPVLVSLAFFFIADLDSPRGGLIRVQPRNLINLSQSLSGQ